MEQFPKIAVESKEHFMLYLLKQDLGFRTAYVTCEPPASGDSLLADTQSASLKKIHYFDKGSGVCAMLYFENDSSDPAQRLARIVKVNSKDNSQCLQRLEHVVAQFSSEPWMVIDRKDRALLLFHEAMAAWNAGNKELFQEAIELADMAIELDPSLVRALNCKGSSQAWLGDNMGAIRTYLTAIKTNSRCVRPWLNLGNRFRVLYQRDRSLYAYRIGVERPPLWNGDDKLQIESKKQYLKWNGDCTAETIFLLAARNKEMDQLLEQYYVATGGTISTDASIGVKYGRKGEWSKALEAFSGAAAQHPDDVMALNNMAHALNQLGRYKEAMEYCDRALILDPDAFPARQTRMEALLMLGKYQEALDGLILLSDADPCNPAINYYRALIEDEMGLWQQAASTYSRLVIDVPEYCQPQHNYARRRIQELMYHPDHTLIDDARFAEEMLEERRHHVTKLLDCCSESTTEGRSEEFKIGLRSYLDNHREAALYHFASEQAQNQNCPEALSALALVLMGSKEMDDITQSLKYCDQILILDEFHLDALVLKAEAFLQEARLKGGTLNPEHPLCMRARECYNWAATIDARHPGVLYWKALAEDAMGATDAASKTFRQFVVVAPNELKSQLNYARTRLHHMEFWNRHNKLSTVSQERGLHVRQD